MNETIDPYELLGVPRDADAATIEAARRRLAAALHPDARPDQPEEVRRHLEDLLGRINAAADAARSELGRTSLAPAPPTQAAGTRSLPCPWCDEWSAHGDLKGRDALLECPSCGGAFPATVGAFALSQFLTPAYDLVQFEIRSPDRLFQFVGPQAAHLADGDEFSIVYDGRHRPWALVNHGVGDRSWRLGAPEPDACGELSAGRVVAALGCWLACVLLAVQSHGSIASAARLLLVAAAVSPFVVAPRKGRGRFRWLLLSLATLSAAAFVLAFGRGRESRGADTHLFRVWLPLGVAAVVGAVGGIVAASGGSAVWILAAAALGYVGARNAGLFGGGAS